MQTTSFGGDGFDKFLVCILKVEQFDFYQYVYILVCIYISVYIYDKFDSYVYIHITHNIYIYNIIII